MKTSKTEQALGRSLRTLEGEVVATTYGGGDASLVPSGSRPYGGSDLLVWQIDRPTGSDRVVARGTPAVILALGFAYLLYRRAQRA